jgi:hypothetical protein
MFSMFWVVFSTIVALAWSIPFLIAPIIGLRFYIISESRVIKLLKRLPKYSSLINNDNPDGWIVGWPFIGYIESSGESRGRAGDGSRLYLFTTIRYYTKKMKEIDSIDSSEEESSATDDESSSKGDKCEICLFDREGSYTNIYYMRRYLEVRSFEARKNQQKIIDQIIEFYDSRRHAVAILYGEKGVGKSMIPILLAKSLMKRSTSSDTPCVNFCDTHKPTDPGDHFNNLYQRVDPTKQNPLVVVFEEFDGMIHGIHHQTIKRHDDVTTAVCDKSTWNQFMDRFDRGYYPWTILLMTTNHHPDTIDRMDPSYIRTGRVNLTFEVILDPSS